MVIESRLGGAILITFGPFINGNDYGVNIDLTNDYQYLSNAYTLRFSTYNNSLSLVDQYNIQHADWYRAVQLNIDKVLFVGKESSKILERTNGVWNIEHDNVLSIRPRTNTNKVIFLNDDYSIACFTDENNSLRNTLSVISNDNGTVVNTYVTDSGNYGYSMYKFAHVFKKSSSEFYTLIDHDNGTTSFRYYTINGLGSISLSNEVIHSFSTQVPREPSVNGHVVQLSQDRFAIIEGGGASGDFKITAQVVYWDGTTLNTYEPVSIDTTFASTRINPQVFGNGNIMPNNDVVVFDPNTFAAVFKKSIDDVNDTYFLHFNVKSDNTINLFDYEYLNDHFTNIYQDNSATVSVVRSRTDSYKAVFAYVDTNLDVQFGGETSSMAIGDVTVWSPVDMTITGDMVVESIITPNMNPATIDINGEFSLDVSLLNVWSANLPLEGTYSQTSAYESDMSTSIDLTATYDTTTEYNQSFLGNIYLTGEWREGVSFFPKPKRIWAKALTTAIQMKFREESTNDYGELEYSFNKGPNFYGMKSNLRMNELLSLQNIGYKNVLKVITGPYELDDDAHYFIEDKEYRLIQREVYSADNKDAHTVLYLEEV